MTQIKVGDRVMWGLDECTVVHIDDVLATIELKNGHKFPVNIDELIVSSDPELKPGMRVKHIEIGLRCTVVRQIPEGELYAGQYLVKGSDDTEYIFTKDQIIPLPFEPPTVQSPHQVDVKTQQELLDGYYEMMLKEVFASYRNVSADKIGDRLIELKEKHGKCDSAYEYFAHAAMEHAKALLQIRNQNLIK